MGMWLKKYFACYWDKTQNKINIKCSALFNAIISIVSFGKSAMLLFC